MSVVTVLAIGFAMVLAAAWVRERRMWKQFYETPRERLNDASRLYSALLRADIRARYKVVSGAPMMGAGRTAPGETGVVLVHRDDLSRAEEIFAELKDAGRP